MSEIEKNSVCRLLGRCVPQTLAPIWLGATNLLRHRKEKPSGLSRDERQSFVREYGSFCQETLGYFLADWGIAPGDILMVHGSASRMYTYNGNITQVLEMLQELVGTNGTLCMPAYPLMKFARDEVYDLKRTPSAAGMMSEVFRRTPDAIRSCQQRSVVAVGADKEYLVNEHHLSPYGSSEYSPHARLAEKKGKVLCIAMPPTTNSMFHCGEDILKEKFPVNVYFDKLFLFKVRLYNGSIVEVPFYDRKYRWGACCDSSRLLKYFDESIIQHKRFKGIDFYLTFADRFLDRLLELANKGIHMYGFNFPPPEKILSSPKVP